MMRPERYSPREAAKSAVFSSLMAFFVSLRTLSMSKPKSSSCTMPRKRAQIFSNASPQRPVSSTSLCVS